MKDFKVYQASGYLTKLVTDASDVRKEYEEISGSLVEFDTPISAPLLSLIVDINPVQDLHGQDSPYPAGGGKNKFSGQWNPDVIGTYAGFEMPATSYCRLAVYDKNNGADISGAYIGLSEDGIGTPVTWVVSNGEPYEPSYNTTNGCYTVGYAERKYVSIYPPTQETLTKLLNRFNILCFVDDLSGTWEYSPYENICPITGWTGANIYHSGEDTSNPTVYTVSWTDEAGTVYGGIVDVVSGVLTQIWKVVEAQTLTWTARTGSMEATISDRKYGVDIYPLSSHYKGDWLTGWASLTNGIIGAISNYIVIRIKDDANQASLADWNDYLTAQKTAGTPVQILYELATPVEYQITPEEINTLIGVNNIWADTGDVSVKYRTH